MDNKNILVTGTGKIDAKPDTIIINLTLISENYDYDRVLQINNQKLEKLYNALNEIISKDDIKTTFFTVDTNYQNKLVNGTYQNIFIGYICRQSLKIEIKLDMLLLNQIIKAITNSGTDPSFNINFTLKNSDYYINKAIELAINDAKEKAKLISKITGVTIKDIVNIEYRNISPILFSDTLYSPLLVKTEASIDIVPEDITIIENITVTYNSY